MAGLVRLAATGIKVIASGGISSREDVQSLIALHNPNISGVIIGKALYEEKVSLPDLVCLAEQSAQS